MLRRIHTLVFIAALLTMCTGLAPAAPLGRSFTYQGQLSLSGTPVDGMVTLRFSLWDAAGTGSPPTGGTQIGATQTVTNVSVSGGVFSVALNGSDEFGAQAFDGNARWLQIEVCADSTCASSTVLGPRQAVTAAPYSLGPWQMSGTNLAYTDGNVGIGTTSPAYALHIKKSVPAIILQDTAVPTTDQSGYLTFWNSNPTETAWVGFGTIGSPVFSVVNVRTGGDIQLYTAAGQTLTAKSTGSVGIGTANPAAKLDVRGDLRFGTSGEFYATGGGEALKIVRGGVLATGTIDNGSGFTVSHPSTGVYNIFFSPAFAGVNHTSATVTPVATSGTLIAMLGSLSGPSSISVRIVNGSGTATDGAFNFIVTGAR